MANYFDGMSTEQIIKAVAELRVETETMKAGQRAYLDRRAKRQVSTLTDILLERQQVTLQRLLDLIDKMNQEYQLRLGGP